MCRAIKKRYVLHMNQNIIARKRKNQVILLMITDGEKYHYLAVKILSRLLYGITSNHHGDFTAGLFTFIS